MDANTKVTVFNKGASITTITYNNWDESTSRSITVLAGTKMELYNWNEDDPDNPGELIAVEENILNMQPGRGGGMPIPANSGHIELGNFGYDTNQVSIKIATGVY